MKELLAARPVEMAEVADAAALRDARHPQGVRRHASRSTASISRCAAGEVCALVGQNGAGKSTLMSILVGRAPRRTPATMLLDGAPFRRAVRSTRAAPAWR